MTNLFLPAAVVLATPAGSGFVLGYAGAPGRVVLAVTAALVLALVTYLAVLVLSLRRGAVPVQVTPRFRVRIDPYAQLRAQVADACATLDRIGERLTTGAAAEMSAVDEARQAVASMTALTAELGELRSALDGRAAR